MALRNDVLLPLLVLVACAVASHAQNDPADYLKPHNDVRQLVGVGPLAWDADLASSAQDYAKSRAGDCRTFTLPGGPIGENTFWAWGRTYAAADAVAAWVAQRQYYDRDSNSCQLGQSCVQYTQVVWRSSTKLGCGSTTCNNGDFFVVCYYSPGGNYFIQRPY